MRLGQLARKLDIKQSEITKFLSKELQIEIEENPNSKIDDEHIEVISKKFTTTDIEVIKEEIIEEKTIDSAKKEEETLAKTPEKEVPTKIELREEDKHRIKKSEVIKAPKVELAGPTITGKIDLPDFGATDQVEVDGVMIDKAELKRRKQEATEKEAEIKKEAAKKRREEREIKNLAAAERENHEIVSLKEKQEQDHKFEAKRKRLLKKEKEQKEIFYAQKAKTITAPVKKKRKKKIIVATSNTVTQKVEEKVVKLPTPIQPKIDEPQKTGFAKLWDWLTNG